MKETSLSWTIVLVGASLLSPALIHAENWPGWRGNGLGLSSEKDLPLEWGEDHGVRWKVPLPGAGHSSPIVWGGRVFVTIAVAQDPNVESFRGGVYMGGNRAKPDDSEYAYQIVCLNADDGQILWSKTVATQRPKTRRHTKNTYASETPVTDGRYVFASFGSAGLHGVDFDGNTVWQRDLGLLRVRAGWGTGSSPVLSRNMLIVNYDSDDDSYIAAFDKTTGESVWRTERKEGASWGTPLLFETDGRATIVTNATKRMRGYDAGTGALQWECAGGSMIVVPTPVASHGLIFLSSGHNLMPPQPIIAIRPEATGDITPKRGESTSQGVAWSHLLGGPYVTSPIAVGDYLYVPLDNGYLTCYEAQTGEPVYDKQRLGTRNTITAAPVASEDRIYLQTEDGECYVVKQGRAFEILAVNKLDGVFCASPAVSGARLFLRSRKHLYCIGK